MAQQLNGGIWIPDDVWNLDLPVLHRVFLSRLISLSKRDGASWAGDEFLAESLKCTPQHVRKMRKQLEASGHIVTDGYGHNRRLSVKVAPAGTSSQRRKQPEAQELQPEAQKLRPQLRQEATRGAKSIEENRNSKEVVKRERTAPKKESKPNDLQTVIDAFEEAGSSTQLAERFWNYYEANGWKVGRASMRDWKAAARNWITDRNGYNGTKASNETAPGFDPKKMAELIKRKHSNRYQ